MHAGAGVEWRKIKVCWTLHKKLYKRATPKNRQNVYVSTL